MMAWLYILYSKGVSKYYVGITTESPESRLVKHKTKYYEKQYTSIADDWEIKLSILCLNINEARKNGIKCKAYEE
jgi:predicted GIY-YIG superfamily endonuclease